MAILTTDAVNKFKGLRALVGGNRECMTCEAFLRLVRPPDAEQFSDPDRHHVRQNLVSPRVLILSRPDAVLIL